MVLTFIGASLLWVGWFGFNAGSAVTAGMQAGMAMTVTQIATAVAALHLDARRVDAARQADRHRHLLGRGRRPRRHHSGVGLCRPDRLDGASASPPASLCYWGVTGLKRMLGYDDALDAFGVHGVGGIVGALLTGVFAIEQYGGTAGLIEGNAAQVLNQVYGIADRAGLRRHRLADHPQGARRDHRAARDRRGGARRSRYRAARRDRLTDATILTDIRLGRIPGTAPSVGGPGRKTGASHFFRRSFEKRENAFSASQTTLPPDG